MKRIIFVMTALLLMLASLLTVSAAEGNVTYNGNAKQIIFSPGSPFSPTDLFPDLKDVMPGDSLTQKITVKNAAASNVKVKIYMRALGAHENSVDFLSQLGLRVEKTNDNQMGYMFDANANETAQLTDWVCLGTLYSGGVVNLNVILDVPTTLDNDYQQLVGLLDWEFMIEEFPIDPDDPQPPKTGIDLMLFVWYGALICSAVAIIFLILWRRKKKKEEANQQAE